MPFHIRSINEFARWIDDFARFREREQDRGQEPGNEKRVGAVVCVAGVHEGRV